MDRVGLLAERLAVLEARLDELERRRDAGPVDAIGAPIDRAEWSALREAAKETISEIGVEEAARRYGVSPERLRSIVYRRDAPGRGTRARLAVVIGGKRI